MQQINLYQAQFKPEKVALPPRTMLIVFILTGIVCATVSIYLQQQNAILQSLVTRMEQQQFADSELALDTPLLDAQLQQLQQQRSHKQRLLDYLSQHSFGNKDGFSALLEDLSGYRIEGVWLTSFSFARGGESFSLKGRALQSSLVPRYIDSLAQAPSFKGKQFTVFQLHQPDAQQNIYEFKLHTEERDKAEAMQ